MCWIFAALYIAGLAPLLLAWWSQRGASLAHALAWAILAWLAWGATAVLGDSADWAHYGSLCLTGCAGVAVLGARRPHVFAWNFVVLGLLAVMLLPMLETFFVGTSARGSLRIFFMGATIAVGILNYLPTRLALAALLLLIVCNGEMVRLFAPDWLPGETVPILAPILLAAVPWLAWGCLRRRSHNVRPCDRFWLDFRDTWGLFWAQRVREQFNRAAENAGLNVELTWRGMRGLDAGEEPRALEILRAILQRFLATD